MKNVVGLVAALLSITANASSPDGDSGATGYFSESLYASERSTDFATYVSLNRQEYSNGYSYGYINGHVDGVYFFCQLEPDENLLSVDGDAKSAVIHVDSDAIEYCWSNQPPVPITFECKASGYMESKGVSNYETAYFDGYEYKVHTRYVDKAVDCVVSIGDEIVLDATSGIVWDGMAHVGKYIEPNKGQEELEDQDD